MEIKVWLVVGKDQCGDWKPILGFTDRARAEAFVLIVHANQWWDGQFYSRARVSEIQLTVMEGE